MNRPNRLQRAESKSVLLTQQQPIRKVVELSDRKFPVASLPKDMQRVYHRLAAIQDEEYAKLWVFTLITAIELHRAWHMTLLTSKILQQIKDRFNLRMSWHLGVVKLVVRAEDGALELNRKVPYDFDSEYQDIYTRIAVALIEGHITVDEALLYQSETKKGMHTAKSGLFLRDFPGRLLLYPAEAATCAIIFFNGHWIDAAIAALTGFSAGIMEWSLSSISSKKKSRKTSSEAKILIDLVVGLSTGIIGGLMYRYATPFCLSSVFLGTLYWFFYGAAFVVGLLEIIAGELQTGVIRFIAVSVKTFVLSLGSMLGLMISSGEDASAVWFESSNDYCDPEFKSGKWWRIPMYLLCSVTVLGQFRLPVVQYWRGLIIMLCAYEVQYDIAQYYANEGRHLQDNLDTAMSNIVGAAAATVSACTLTLIINTLRNFYSSRLLQNDQSRNSRIGTIAYNIMTVGVKVGNCLKIGRESDALKLKLAKKLEKEKRNVEDPSHPSDSVRLDPNEENLLLETIVGAQGINIWSILMPAIYQLVPGSIIAKLWFESILPPTDQNAADNVFSNLMVTSASLALGLIVGGVLVQLFDVTFTCVSCAEKSEESRRRHSRRAGLFTAAESPDDDPETLRDLHGAVLQGIIEEEEQEVEPKVALDVIEENENNA